MQASVEQGSVVFVGAPQVGKYTLIRQLHPDAGPKAAAPTEQCANTARAAVYPLHLDTKYYTADILAHSVTLDHNDLQQQQTEEPAQQHDAIVLVCGADDPATFTRVRQWAEANGASGAAICLLVVNKADKELDGSGGGGGDPSGGEGRAVLPAGAEWCLDHGFEYVEAAAGAPVLDAALSLDGDRQGVARVREALEAHMWPGLELKQQLGAGKGPGAPAAAAADDTRDQGAEAGQAAGAAGPPERGAAAAASAAAPDSAAAPSAASAASTEEGTKQRAAGGSPGGAERDEAGVRGASDPREDADLEAGVESFERLMQQLQGARERLAKLPDSERRAQAAALALKFASMLGGSEDEEDEGSADGLDGGPLRGVL